MREPLKVGDKGVVVSTYSRSEPKIEEAEVVKVGRKYAYLNIPSWSPYKVDQETGYVQSNYSDGTRFFTHEQWDLHRMAKSAHEYLRKEGVSFEFGSRAKWDDERVIELARAVRKIQVDSLD